MKKETKAMKEDDLIYTAPRLDEIDLGGCQVRGDETGMSEKIEIFDDEEDIG